MSHHELVLVRVFPKTDNQLLRVRESRHAHAESVDRGTKQKSAEYILINRYTERHMFGL